MEIGIWRKSNKYLFLKFWDLCIARFIVHSTSDSTTIQLSSDCDILTRCRDATRWIKNGWLNRPVDFISDSDDVFVSSGRLFPWWRTKILDGKLHWQTIFKFPMVFLVSSVVFTLQRVVTLQWLFLVFSNPLSMIHFLTLVLLGVEDIYVNSKVQRLGRFFEFLTHP